MLEDPNALSKLEDLKTKLSRKSYKPKMRHYEGLTFRPTKETLDSLEEGLDSREKFFMNTSIFKKIFIFSLLFLIISLSASAYIFFFQANIVSEENIEISVLGKTFTRGGEELQLIVNVINKNTTPLESAYLTVEHAKSAFGLSEDAILESSTEKERQRHSLENIDAGSVNNKNIKVILFGEQGSIQPIKITLEYRLKSSSAIFVKEKIYEVSIISEPLNVSIDGPLKISPNQDINFDIKTTLDSAKPMNKILLKIDYPHGFQFISAKPAPSFANNIWRLRDLNPGSEHKITLFGKMVDAFEGEEKIFKLSTGFQSNSDKSLIETKINSLTHKISIEKQFIETKLSINGVFQKEYSSYSKSSIHGKIFWKNNLDTKIKDLLISVKVSGNALDRKTVNAQEGFYNSLDDTITWDRNLNQSFVEVGPSESGSVSFSLVPVQFSSISSLLDNPVINLEISVSGQQELSGFETEEIKSSASTIIKIISDLGLITRASYFNGPFKNIGPLPPVVGKETTYTITWSISNTFNNLSNARVVANLPIWTQFTGSIDPKKEDLVYDPTKRELVWNIGKIPRGAGIGNIKKYVSFQVALLPSFSQLNTSPVIINPATLTADDDFAKVPLVVEKNALSTTLINEPNFPTNGHLIIEAKEAENIEE